MADKKPNVSTEPEKPKPLWERMTDKWWVAAPLAVGVLAAMLLFGFEGLRVQLSGEVIDDVDLNAGWLIADFLLIFLYAIALFGACKAGEKSSQSETGRKLGDNLAWAAVVAAVLDVFENVGLLAMAFGEPSSFWATWTTAFSWPKWGLVLAATAYAVWMVVLGWLRSLRTSLQDQDPDDIGRAAKLAMSILPQALTVPVPPKPSRIQPDIGAQQKVGICCSGGGIRSASYNLGALQALDELGVVGRADYLAAVSGGSYIAGGMTMARKNVALQDHPLRPAPFMPRTPEERHFRDHSTYIAPGWDGRAVAIGNIMRGIFFNVLLLLLYLFVISRPLGWLIGSQYLYADLEGPLKIRTSSWLAIAIPAGLAVALGLYGGARRLKPRLRAFLTRMTYLLLAIAAGLFAIHVLIPWVPELVGWAYERIESVSSDGGEVEDAVSNSGFGAWVAGLGITSTVVAAARTLFAKKRSLFAMLVAAVVVPLLIGGLATAWALAAARNDPGGKLQVFFGWTEQAEWVWVIIAGLALILSFMRFNVIRWSLHGFYKRRLASAYAIRRVDANTVEPFTYQDRARLPDGTLSTVKLSDYQTGPDGWGLRPELIVCAAANVSDIGLVPPGRNAVPFTFTAEEVGMPSISMVATEEMEAALEQGGRDDNIDVPATIAVSGAAVSPGMGKQSKPALSALMTLCNIRLGVWLPNPYWIEANRGKQTENWDDWPRGTYLAKEMLSVYQMSDRYLYVTDGGHYENLGIVELLRRGCTEIYCIDASGDDVTTFNTIGQALSLARSELGVEVDINPELMRPVVEETPTTKKKPRKALVSPTDHVVGRIRWPDGQTEGHVVLCKTAVTADSPADVRFYQERNPIFPNHSTIDQLFDGERFEAYRALGAFTARRGYLAMEQAKEEAVAWQDRFEAVDQRLQASEEMSAEEADWAAAQRTARADQKLDIDRTMQLEQLDDWSWDPEGKGYEQTSQ